MKVLQLTPRFASTPERRNRNINLSKYFKWGSNPVDFTVTLCAAAPRPASFKINNYKNKIYNYFF